MGTAEARNWCGGVVCIVSEGRGFGGVFCMPNASRVRES